MDPMTLWGQNVISKKRALFVITSEKLSQEVLTVCTLYPYKPSPIGLYVLMHDGREVIKGSEDLLWCHIHRRHSFSVEHALKYEGYSIKPLDIPPQPMV